jgi:antitoxin ParD1/3/4
MSTLNVSMPESMRDYIERQAEAGQYSASEYIRHLIREDQKRTAESERNYLWELLAISAKQLDDGDFADVTVESLMAEGDARRAKEGKSAA